MSRHAEELSHIRATLLIGLACYGQCVEIEELHDTMALAGKPLTKGLKPLHPTGDSTVVTRFADALRMVDSIGGAP